MSLKYVIFPGQTGEVVIIFHPAINHSEVAKSFEYEHGKPVSAGMVYRDANKNICCHGRSATLDIGPGKDDEDLITAFLEVQ
jgi:hypothetical protein